MSRFLRLGRRIKRLKRNKPLMWGLKILRKSISIAAVEEYKDRRNR